MTRFEDTLHRDLHVIADRATPSPDAWAQIQSRIAAEEPFQETEIIMLTDNTTTTKRLRPHIDTKRRWPVVAAAAAVGVLAIGAIALVNRDDSTEQPADVPAPTIAPAPEPETVGVASPLPGEGEALPPGRYAPFTLGFPVTFEVPETGSPWTVQVNDAVAVTIGPEGSFVNFSRLGSLYDAAQSDDPDFTGLGSIPPDDVDVWIEANDVIVDDSREATVDDRPAKVRQVRAPDGAGQQTCPPEVQPCVRFSSASADLQDTWDLPSIGVYGPLPHSFWIVELDDFEPLAIWVHTDTADPQSWLDDVQPLIDSIELGDPAPATEFGQARLSTFDVGGADELPFDGAEATSGRYTSDALGVPVTFDLTDGAAGNFSVLSEAPGAVEFQVEGGPAVEYFGLLRIGSFYNATEALDTETTGPGSIPADDIDGWIESLGMTLESGADVSVGGRSAQLRRVILDTFPDGNGFGFSRSADLGSEANSLFGGDWINAIWIVEMDEFEPVMIFAATDGADQPQWLDEVVQPIVDSIEFGEPAPVVEGGTARIPERIAVTASYAGVRTDGAVLADGSIAITYLATSEAPMAGEIVGTGTYLASAVTTGSDEYTFTGTIDGVGTGTLTYTDEWTATGPTESIITTTLTGGTGDFAGVSGTGTSTVDTSDKVGADDTITGSNTFDLVVPRSG